MIMIKIKLNYRLILISFFFAYSVCSAASNNPLGEQLKIVSNHNGLHLDIESVHYTELYYRSDADIWWPKPGIRIPYHHAATIHWTNINKFKAIFEVKESLVEVKFKVAKREIYKVPNRRQWTSTYHCEILSATQID